MRYTEWSNQELECTVEDNVMVLSKQKVLNNTNFWVISKQELVLIITYQHFALPNCFELCQFLA